MRYNHARQVIEKIRSHHRVFIHGGAATPNVLLDALAEGGRELENVELVHLHTEGPCRYAEPKFAKSFKVVNLFVGANIRARIDRRRIDYLPCSLSEIPNLFLSRTRPIDVAVLHLSPPDQYGYCSLGVSVDVARAAFESAEIILAQINRQMPFVYGDGIVHIRDLDGYVEVDVPLFEPIPHVFTSADEAIGKNVAALIEDGSCLQVGIGAVPDATMRYLHDRRHLGVHTEMWSDGILQLIRSGVVDNSKKTVHAGKTVSSFVIGSRAVYDFINNNHLVLQLGSDFVNNPNVIGKNDKVVALNSALAVDLTGQICSDSIGNRIVSGFGGQLDFMRGAALSRGGKPIIALASRTKNGQPKIVPTLINGSGVVTTRAQVHYVVTEFGVADLYGKTLGERAQALIEVSHPEDRESLAKAWFELA